MTISVNDVLEFLGPLSNYFLYDNFKSTDHINVAVTQTAVIYPYLHDFSLHTGVQQDSEARAYYANNIMNPQYAKLLFRLQVPDLDDYFAFIGFKLTNAAPTWDMTESHFGIMIHDGNIYLSSANELGAAPGQQRTLISGVEAWRDNIFKLEYTKISVQPVPYTTTGLHGPYTIEPSRFWTERANNTTRPPEDVMHYILFYIKNNIGAEKYLRIRKLIYYEDFAD